MSGRPLIADDAEAIAARLRELAEERRGERGCSCDQVTDDWGNRCRSLDLLCPVHGCPWPPVPELA